MSNKKNHTIKRKIHFYKFDIKELRNGSNDFFDHSNPFEIFDGISKLSFIGNHKKSRFLYNKNNDVTFLYDTTILPKEIRGKYALSRRSSLPELEKNGKLEPLNIPPNSGLAEITHFIYYHQEKVLGVEYNFFGPRPTSLVSYLIEKSKNFQNPFEYIYLYPILNKDLEIQLNEMGEINILQMELARNELNILKELDEDLHSAFEAASKVSEAESVEIILRKKKYAREGFKLPFSKKKLKEILSIDDNRQKFNRFKAYAESKREERTQVFDLLEDKMIKSKEVVAIDGRSRSVDSDSMFEKISEVYHELKGNF